MAVPIILAVIGITGAVSGLAMGADGTRKIQSANESLREAEQIQKTAIDIFKAKSKKAISIMDDLGKQELQILGTFDRFSDYIEKIQGRPLFRKIRIESLDFEEPDVKELKKVSTGANVLISGLGGAVAGTAGGFAAVGATTSAVLALGTTSTGIAISELSGVAATNATIAAIGGGSLAAGGGGMALGSAVLGGMAAGIGIMFGGLVFEITGENLNKSADKAMLEAKNTERNVSKVIEYCEKLIVATDAFGRIMAKTANMYLHSFQKMIDIIDSKNNYDWSNFSEREKEVIENTILYVGLLYNMCKVQLVKKTNEELSEVNEEDIKKAVTSAGAYLS